MREAYHRERKAVRVEGGSEEEEEGGYDRKEGRREGGREEHTWSAHKFMSGNENGVFSKV